MQRRYVRDGGSVSARLEHRESTTREFQADDVLNILQPVKPGMARFTVEGEGPNIWVADASAFDGATEPVIARKAT